ncbi:hypothetical protein [Chryseobacterium gambrini]|uniref:hypothetical protein n=1 Tax=Chryseobacterium gambrini TaxID=373672 RepID=UPI0022F3E4B9|nr:hypothetical protein [Chryseobacterium gambrini]WBX98210.1 hypothetical protein PE065_02895 [Chryseobacterium gambrini]
MKKIHTHFDVYFRTFTFISSKKRLYLGFETYCMLFLRPILFLIFVHCFISGKSQEYSVQLKSFSTILNSGRVTDYEIDDNKNLWIFSNTGFIKYDGCNIIKFKADFKGRTLEKVSRAGKYLLILFSNGNLLFFDTDTYKYLDLKKYRVLDVCYYNGFVYMLHPGYIIQKYPINDLKKPVQSIKIGKGFNYTRYGDNQIFVSKDGIFASFSQRGIYKIEREKYYPLLTGSHINGDSRYNEGFKELHGKTYFIGLEHTYEYNPSTNTLEKTSDKKKPNSILYDLNKSISDVIDEGSKVVYINEDNSSINIRTNKALFSFNSVGLRKLSKIDDTYIVASALGIYFITKKEKLIENLPYKKLKDLTVKRKIIEWNDNIYFFGFPNIYVLKKDNTLEEYDMKYPAINNEHTLSIYSVTAPIIYDCVHTPAGWFAGTEGQGVVKISDDLKTKEILKIYPFNYSIGMAVYGIFYDKENNMVYSGDEKYLYSFHPENINDIKKIKHSLPGHKVKEITKIPDTDILVITTLKGALIYDLKKGTMQNIITNHSTSDIFADKENRKIWITYEKGIFIVDMDNYKKITAHPFNYLKNPIATAIVQDNYKRIWISTYSGIVLTDPFLKNEIIYTPKNGLLNAEFNFKSALKLKNGKLIFGGISGYDIINPQKDNNSGSRLQIEDYMLIGKDTIICKIKNNFIKYDPEKYFCKLYVSKGIKSNYKTSLKYKIDNGSWIDMDDDTYINLVGLAAGNHEIMVEGLNESGQKIPAQKISVKVTEFFFKSKLFLVLVLASHLLLMAALIYFIIKRQTVKKETIEEINMDLHDEIGTIITKTKLMFETTDLSNTENKSKIANNLNHVNFSFREHLNSSKLKKRTLYELNDECVDVILNVTQLKNILFQKEVDIKSDSKINNDKYKDIKLCIYEIMNNIAKHSLTKTLYFKLIQQKKNIEIILITQEDTDFYNYDHAGNGLRNIQKRCQRQGGDFKIFQESGRIYFDLKFKL